jgi:hypothetical protein
VKGKTAAPVTYSSNDIMRLTGVSYRQVDYWVRTGLLVTAVAAEGSGTVRKFAAIEVTVAQVIASLRTIGVGEGASGAVGSDLLRQVAAAVRAGRERVDVGSSSVVIGEDTVTLSVTYR